MKLWKYMTPCEKGALLLAYQEGKTIEYHYLTDKNWVETRKGSGSYLGWLDDYYYRVKPKPAVTQVVLKGWLLGGGIWAFDTCDDGDGRRDTHKITFNLVDGEPDCNSIKMIKL